MKNEQQPQVNAKPLFSRVSGDLDKYQEISTDVWKIFKKFHAQDADLNEFAPDVSVLDEKYQNNELYGFMQDLLKVYFRELVKMKGEGNGSFAQGRT